MDTKPTALGPLSRTATDPETFDVREYVEVLLKWRLVIAACLVIIFAIVAINTFLAQPVYRAKVRISIERENPQILSFEEVVRMDPSQSDYLLTQVDILKSRSLANDVILRMNLDQQPGFAANESFSLLAWLRSALDLFSRGTEKVRSDQAPPLYSPLASAYLARLGVNPVLQTRLVDVSFESYDPEIAAAVANRHVQAYIDKNLELRFQASQGALTWLNQKLIDVKNELAAAEKALQQFREQEDIISLGDIMSLSQNQIGDSLIQQRIQELSKALTAARIERINLENTRNRLEELEQDETALRESFPDVIGNDLINQLKQSLAETQRKQSELREKYGERHPTLMATNAEIAQQENRILQEIKAIFQSISTRYEMALEREQSLDAELEQEKRRAQELTSKGVQYSVLQREVESNKNLYDMLLKRVKETALTSGLETSNVKIIDQAEVPGWPVKPRKMHNLLLGLVVGLGVGVGLAFFLEHLDDSIESPEDVEEYLNVPFLGLMGHVQGIDQTANGDQKPRAELFALGAPDSPIAESLRNIRTYITFRLRGLDEKSLMVTSANMGEGKTLFAANMAIMLATAGKRTVLVSTDMRKPRIFEIFAIDRSPGLSDALVGEASFDAVIHDTDISPNLSCVPAGTSLPSPAELLSSEKMGELHALMEERFDIVIYDTPPILYVTDSLILSQIARNVVFVVGSGDTHKKAARDVIKQLSDVEARIMGAVLNETKAMQGRFYGRYYRRYYRHDDRYFSDRSQVEEDPPRVEEDPLRTWLEQWLRSRRS